MHAVEEHTLLELQILPENNHAPSILRFFDRTETQGGRDYLKVLLQNPPATSTELLNSQKLFKSIAGDPEFWKIDIHRSYVNAVEGYHALNVAHSMSQDVVMHWLDTFVYFLKSPEEFYRIQSGLFATIRFKKAIKRVIESLSKENTPATILNDIENARHFLALPVISALLKINENKLSKARIFYLDYFFRIQHKEDLRTLIDFFYRMDAFRAVALTAITHSLTFSEFNQNQDIKGEGMWHPLLNNAVSNHFDINSESAVCLMTGANTSGKTTFLKTLGIIVYLAHLGWPVPADKLSLPFLDKLFTSIHLTDNLDLGHSHFYTEMMRVKVMLNALMENDRCLIIVDELFRGTNQEDALHCSKAVLTGFTYYKSSFFIVSTHLLECLDHFQNAPEVHFKCFRTLVDGNTMRHTFKLETGIATEKVGRIIMDQIGITDILENAKRLPDH